MHTTTKLPSHIDPLVSIESEENVSENPPPPIKKSQVQRSIESRVIVILEGSVTGQPPTSFYIISHKYFSHFSIFNF